MSDPATPAARVLVILPTYNEAESLPRVLDRLHASQPDAHALVVDDGSPDGTGTLAEQLAGRDPRVHVLRRTTKTGLGRAYLAGFTWARAHGFDVLVEMDADGSHPPEELPQLLAALDDADLVLGSRYVPGGRVADWPLHRLLLSRAGNRYTRWALRLPLADATGGYRVVRGELIDRLPLDDVASQGYCFQVDWAWRAWRNGARVREVPITFTEREFGRSKMSGSIVGEALARVTVWALRDRLADRLPRLVRRPVPGRVRDGGRSGVAR
ncbi:polyprenol monophosphomannose synthase [Geodermatophilus sp. YIM 151500]|uniref:polyprenol monophosphomannose synthase n=1 Tax=Geodermatophilus sp. YIM 151500 TaxID=2984531 RepID=UPI0021E3AFD1|nr:polyprenol monophosphomannose synthase [Geodermatophilus sp. YIM 151500]MCV2489094.1 polyprenol monophosphomannose synthase [Geodermatophilus sp. YIM 151500]